MGTLAQAAQEHTLELARTYRFIEALIVVAWFLLVLFVLVAINREQRRTTKAIEHLIKLREHEMRAKRSQAGSWPTIQE